MSTRFRGTHQPQGSSGLPKKAGPRLGAQAKTDPPARSEDHAGTTHSIAPRNDGADEGVCRPQNTKKVQPGVGIRLSTGYFVFDMQKKATSRRPFLGMHFKCCNIYSRIHLNKKQTAFVGWCPKCTAKVEVKVSPDGSNSQFFTAG